MKTIYLSGPMSGYEHSNFPAFDYAAGKLREEGFAVFSPADNDRRYGLTGELGVPLPPGVTINTLMKDDTTFICDEADTIAMLPGWERSAGANAEIALAKALGLNVLILGKEYAVPKKTGVLT